jgi:hypothetical protein
MLFEDRVMIHLLCSTFIVNRLSLNYSHFLIYLTRHRDHIYGTEMIEWFQIIHAIRFTVLFLRVRAKRAPNFAIGPMAPQQRIVGFQCGSDYRKVHSRNMVSEKPDGPFVAPIGFRCLRTSGRDEAFINMNSKF